MTEIIPDFHVSTISPVSIDRFSPNFCHWYILGVNTDDLITFLGQKVKVQGHHRGGGAQHSTLPSSATFSSCYLFSYVKLTVLIVVVTRGLQW